MRKRERERERDTKTEKKDEREREREREKKRSRASNLLVGQVRSGQVPYITLLNVFFWRQKKT